MSQSEPKAEETPEAKVDKAKKEFVAPKKKQGNHKAQQQLHHWNAVRIRNKFDAINREKEETSYTKQKEDP